MPEFDKVKDSGHRQDFGTGSVRDTNDGKGRFDLIPPYALFRLARHYENGASKYGDRNWEKGQPLSRYLDSAYRHLMKIIMGLEDEDHLSAAIWNLMAIVETKKRIELGLLPEALNNLPKPYDGQEDTMLEILESNVKKAEAEEISQEEFVEKAIQAGRAAADAVIEIRTNLANDTRGTMTEEEFKQAMREFAQGFDVYFNEEIDDDPESQILIDDEEDELLINSAEEEYKKNISDIEQKKEAEKKPELTRFHRSAPRKTYS